MGESQVVENRSKQGAVVTGTGKPMTPIQPIANYWNFTNGDISPDYFDNAKIYDLIVTPNAGMYWLSSRYAYGTSATDWFFGMMWILGPEAEMSEGQLYRSNNEAGSVPNCGIRPIISIPKSSCNIRQGGTNGETYHIEPKS